MTLFELFLKQNKTKTLEVALKDKGLRKPWLRIRVEITKGQEEKKW